MNKSTNITTINKRNDSVSLEINSIQMGVLQRDVNNIYEYLIKTASIALT